MLKVNHGVGEDNYINLAVIRPIIMHVRDCHIL